tara:strand:- start:5177 stop:5494 length:318 start_codon:yes stop_codon:yes gene_type:complete
MQVSNVMLQGIGTTDVMSTATRSLSQTLRIMQRSIKALTLLLRTRVLPIGAERMAESAFPLSLCTTLQLLYQCLACVQIGQDMFRIFAPEDSAMLHASTRYALHL